MQQLPGMFLRGGTPGEFFVQSWSDIASRAPNGGLRFSAAQGVNTASFEGRPLSWQSREAEAAYTVMRTTLANGLFPTADRMLVPLPKPR
jgi:hypothetical protein